MTALLWGKEAYLLEHGIVSVYAVDSKTGQVLVDQNSRISMVPASCLKAMTTAVALQLLGAEKRFETCLEYDGVIDQEKVLHGNLYIRGGGDPCLGSNRVAGSLSWKEQMAVWAEAIEKLGVQRIEGRVVGDASRWEKALAVPSWAWEDLGNYYGAGASALSFHENLYTLIFRPGKKVGDPVTVVRTEPPVPGLVLQSEVTTGPEGSGDQACIYGSELGTAQVVRGTIPLGVEEFTIQGAIPDPATFCANLLAQALKERGIRVEERPLPIGEKRVSFHTTYSPKVADIVYWTNQKSINLYAEHLLKHVGETVRHEGSTQAGLKAMTDFLASQIDLGGFAMMDGSGLSRKNMMTARQSVSILLQMKKSELFPVFLHSLPQKMGLIRAKSGSMSFVKGYVGYAGEIAFAFFVNQCSDSKEVEEKLDHFFHFLLGKADPTGLGSSDRKVF